MTKNIMSIAAAAAIITSGASAFETNTTEVGGATPLLNINGTQGAYVTVGLLAPAPVEVSLDHIGDALLFPAFKSEDGWGTEIVVRNNHDYAIVAKFVAYSAVDSQELRDFNIYLSANDVFRCTMKDGKITTTDDSVNIGAGWGNFENVTLPENTGYVAVYGMLAHPGITWHAPEAAADPTLLDPKVMLKAVYTNALDTFRAGWDTNATMSNGVFVKNYADFNITSPKLPIFDEVVSVDAEALSGTVRIYNADEPRDLIMPATAVDNYTDGFTMLWAPAELAAWSDRNIISGGPGGYDGYSKAANLVDAQTNSIKVAYYTFNNATVDASSSTDLQNKLVVTQPTKRTLVQQGQGGAFWQLGLCEHENIDPVVNGTRYGLVYGANVWDEEENKNTLEADPELSPGNGVTAKKMCHEVGEIANIEAETELADKNGYAVVGFRDSAPAIITQMTASEVGGSREINWINVPVKMTPAP